jgi:MFS family permease
MKRRGFFSLAWVALRDLFDQNTSFGRLAAVHVGMMAGDTLVTVSLAGSLFFSVSPTEAKSKVLAYLMLTFAPFAVVSPVLGPLIDRSVNGRRIIVAVSGLSRVLLCWMMSRHLNSWLLFPEAFAVLVASKLYVVTRGTLVPEMARTDQLSQRTDSMDESGWPSTHRPVTSNKGFAGFNAQLTLLGTGAGLIMGVLGAAILKALNAASVLQFAALVFFFAGLASLRLHKASPLRQRTTGSDWELPHDGVDHVEVSWGLSAMSILRFAIGFLGFLLVFGLRHQHASLTWYAWALGMTGLGSLVGLAIVTRYHGTRDDSTLLAWSHIVLALAAGYLTWQPSLVGQVLLSGVIGLVGAVAQPSFDSITQQHVTPEHQGRTFAKFAVRQQLLWVVGAIIPVAIAMEFTIGDGVIAGICLTTGLVYGLGRRFAR